MGELWHYTCEHSRAKLGDVGELVPLARLAGLDDLPPTSVFVWLTDLSVPIPAALGLTRLSLRCDRTEHRYRVTDVAGVLPWVAVRRDTPPRWRYALESAPGAMPAHWYVSEGPVPVEYAPEGARHG
jgi:hypothetical protein